MGKSSPAAPQAPDPATTANAQSNSNINTANANSTINNVNQVTPWGSQIYTQGPKDDKGVGQWTSTISLSPEQQKLLSSSNDVSQLMAELAKTQAGTVGSSLSKPIDYSSLTQVRNNPLQSSVGTPAAPGATPGKTANGGLGMMTNLPPVDLETQLGKADPINGKITSAGPINGGVGGGGPITNSIGDAGKIQMGIDTNGTENLTRGVQGGGITNGIDMSGVPAMVGGDALKAAMDQNQQAAYKQQSAYLDTSYGQRQHDLENQLVQQGVLQGSDAWNRATQNLGQQRTFDYNNAFNNSFSTGLQANNQLYNQGLTSNQNAYAQAMGNANFANSAQSQGFNQGQSNALLNNTAAGQLNSQRLSQMAGANAGQQQQFGQNAAGADFYNKAQAQGFDQSYKSADQANSAQAQQFAQNAASQAAAAEAQQQQYQQMLASFMAQNQAKGQEFNQNLQAGQFQNATQGQKFNQGLADANLNNATSAQQFGQDSAARAQQLQELYQQQQNPLNMLNALRSGSQVTAPQFGSGGGAGGGGGVAGTDLIGLANNQYNGQLGAYNGQVATNNANTSAGAGLASAAITAMAMY